MKIDQPEHRLSAHVDAFLDRAMLIDGPCWWTAVDSAQPMKSKSPTARANWEAKRRKRGIKPSHLDFYLYQKPIYSQIELKVGDNEETIGQLQTMEALRKRGISTGCAYTVLEFYEIVKEHGYRLHPNAENIAREIEARWRAAQHGADVAKRYPPKPSKPRAAKPSARAVERGNRWALLGR